MLTCCAVASCGRAPDNDGYAPLEQYFSALSPDGEVNAYAYHYDSESGGLTQVMLENVGMGCGSGSVSWYEYDIGVELRWIDATILEVSYPDGLSYQHNVSGDFLGCYDRAVRVVVVPRGARDPNGGMPIKPVEAGHKTSPDGKVTAHTMRYSTEDGGITQVVLFFNNDAVCGDSAVTFYDHDVELQLDWADANTLDIRYPGGQRYDLPPWGTTARCVSERVQVRMRPLAD